MKKRMLLISIANFTLLILSFQIAWAQNIIPDYSFEDSNTWNIWTKVGTEGSITRSDAQAHTGTYSCRFTDPTTSYDGRGARSDTVNVTAENIYDLWGWFYLTNEGSGSVDDTRFRMRVEWRNSSKEIIDTQPGTTGWQISAFDTWEKKESNNLQAPANAEYATVLIECKEDVNNDNDTYIDDIQFGPTGTLPVILSTFTATFLNNIPTLYWQTESETDNLGWYVYRNTENDFTNAEEISNLIDGYGTTSEPHSYIYEDPDFIWENAMPGDIYWYWLESVDLGGMIHHYDKTAHLTIPPGDEPGHGELETQEQFGLFQNNPNPFNPKTASNTVIKFNLQDQAKVEINIYNIKGELVKSIYNGLSESDNPTWDGKNESGKLQPTGIYLYELRINGKPLSTKRIILIN